MKFFKTLITLSFLIITLSNYSQVSCAGASPFCAGPSAVTFPASTGTSAAPGPNYGCLFSQPNPAWYYFQVSTSGTIIINIAGTGGGDVDFICWGPFTTATGNCGNLTALNTVDCSYSGSPTETCTISGAIVGQYYMLLITNFSGMTQNITFGQNPGSTGSTNCALLSGTTSQTICPGATASLSATSSMTLSPTYVWNPGGATTSSISVSPSVTTIYTVTISGMIPGTSTPTVITNTSTVTVLSVPSLTLSTNSLICPGSTINLTASPGFTNYVWTGPPAYSSTTTIANVSIPSATTSMLGTYTVTGKSSQGCSVKATATVGFIPTSSITTTPSYTICQGGTQTFSLTNAIGATSYSWAGPLAFVSSVQNPTISSIMTTQAGIYTVTANFTSGTYTCTTTKTSTVIVVPAYPASLPAMSTVCNNGIINLTAPIGGTTYNWAGPNSFTSSVQSPNITSAGIINNGIYTVTITTGLCVNIGTVAVTVYNPLSFTSIPSNLTLCFGKSGVLNSNGAGGSGIYNYSWSPITDLSNPNSATTTVTGSSTTIYSLTLTDANCAVTLGAVTPVTVTVNPSPVITMSTTNSRGCEAFCTDLISLSVPTSTYCEWRFTDNLAYGGCYNPNFCFPTHGVYGATLTVTDVNGCIDSVKNSSFIIVDPNPSADFSWTPDNSTILINEVNFYDHSSIGLPFNNWHWDFGDVFVNDANDTSNIQNPSHIYENVYSYSVTLTVVNSFGCRDSVMKLLKVEDDFALFIPNAFTPSKADGKNDIFKVSGIGFLSDSFEMRIYDRWGELVFKTNDINKGWDGSIKGGKLANPDVFIYKITIKDFKNKTREYVGHITIL